MSRFAVFGWIRYVGLVMAVTGSLRLGLLAAPPLAQPRDFVWRIEGGRGVVFLAGSLHELRVRDRASQSHYDAFAKCDRIVFEANLAEFEGAEFREEMTRLARLPKGQSWSARITPEARQRLRQLAREHQLQEDEFENFRPWFAANYAMLLMLQDAGFAETHGTDRLFFDRAGREGKSREFLETGRAQLEQLRQLPEQEVLAGLEHDLVAGLEEAKGLVAAWQTGDAMALHQFTVESLTLTPRTVELMLKARNQAWLPRIERWLADTNSTFILVGAGHLVGPTGLVPLLEKRGFRPVQLPVTSR